MATFYTHYLSSSRDCQQGLVHARQLAKQGNDSRRYDNNYRERLICSVPWFPDRAVHFVSAVIHIPLPF